jgi:hypothetical protein
MFDVVTTVSLWELLKHASAWLRNLKKAGDARKRESRDALRKVVIVSRETSVYMRQLRDTGAKDYVVERSLSTQWSELGFELEDLGLNKLARRCRIKGQHWADPGRFDSAFLKKADISLERMEQLANGLLREID